MYSRNTSVRAEVTTTDGFNRYRYAMPPQYGGSRFRRQNSEVIALPDSAFSSSAEEKETPGTAEIAASVSAAEDTVSDEAESTAAAVSEPDTAETAGLAERIGGLLGDVGKDDLLLAAVIVLLYAEKRGSGTIDNELVLILAILLGTR